MFNRYFYRTQGACMFKCILFCSLSLQFVFSYAQSRKDIEPQDWANYVRTAGHGLNKDNIDGTIRDAQ